MVAWPWAGGRPVGLCRSPPPSPAVTAWCQNNPANQRVSGFGLVPAGRPCATHFTSVEPSLPWGSCESYRTVSLWRYWSPREPQDATAVVMIDNNTMLGGHFIRKHHDGSYNHHLKAFFPFLWWVIRLQEMRAVLLPYYERWMLLFGAFAHRSTSLPPSLIRGHTTHLTWKSFQKLSNLLCFIIAGGFISASQSPSIYSAASPSFPLPAAGPLVQKDGSLFS